MNCYDFRRKRRKLFASQAAAAESLGITQASVSYWERGVRPVPRWVPILFKCLENKEERSDTMPRVQKRKAAKDYPEHGIVKGEIYYTWKFRFGPRLLSKTFPKPWELTQSPFLQDYYHLVDEMEQAEAHDHGDLEGLRDDWVSRIDELKDEAESALENMPEQLQESSESGQMLRERIDNLESWSDSLQDVDLEDYEEPEQEKDETEEEYEARKVEALEEWASEKLNELTGLDPGF